MCVCVCVCICIHIYIYICIYMYIVYVFIIVIYTIFIMSGSVTQSIYTNMYVLVHFFNLVLSYLNFTF